MGILMVALAVVGLVILLAVAVAVAMVLSKR